MFAMHSIVLPQCVLLRASHSPCLPNSPQTPTAVPKGFHVRVHSGPTSSFPTTATAQFGVGYYAMARAEPQQDRKRYPSSNSQHTPISFSVSNTSTKSPQSIKLVDGTAANRGYEPDARSTTPRYSIYRSSGDTYIYEASNSSKSDLYSHSEYEQSNTTFSPSSFFSPAMSTDSLTTLKSPATTDTSLPDRSSRPATPPTTSRGPFRSVHIPGFSQAQSALKGIFRAPVSQDHQSSQASTPYGEPAATMRPSRASSPGANTRDTPPIRLSTVSSPPTTVDATPSPTTPLSSPSSSVYAPSTASELEQLERDRVARANAEYNSASSTSPYFTQRRNSILVSAPVPPNRTISSTNGRPHQLYPSMPLRSSPEQQHANVASPYMVETSHASPSIASLRHVRPGEPDDTLSFQPEQSVPRHSPIRDAERRRSPETPPPSVVPQLINEGPHHGRYVPASRTMPPLISQPATSPRSSHAAGTQPSTITDHDGYDSSTMQRERATSIRSQPRVNGSPLAAPASAPRGPRDAPSIVSLPSTPPRSHEHRGEEPRAGVGEHQRDRSRMYVPRTSTVPNEREITVTPTSSSPDRVSNVTNLSPGGTRGGPSSSTAPEQTVEIPLQYYTHRPPSKHASPAASPSRPGTAAVPGYHPPSTGRESRTSPTAHDSSAGATPHHRFRVSDNHDSVPVPRYPDREARLSHTTAGSANKVVVDHAEHRSYNQDQEMYVSRDLDRPRSPAQDDHPHVQDPARHASHGSDSLTFSEHHHRHPPPTSILPHPRQQTVTANHMHIRDSRHHAHRQRRSRASDDSTDEGATPARARSNSFTSESRSRPNYSTLVPHSAHNTSILPPDQSHTRSRENGLYPDGRTPVATEREMGETTHHYTADATTTTPTRAPALIYPSDPLRHPKEPRRRLSDGDATTNPRFPSATPHRRSSDGDRQLHLLYPSDSSSAPLTFLRTVRWTENLVCPSPTSSIQRRKGWFNRRG